MSHVFLAYVFLACVFTITSIDSYKKYTRNSQKLGNKLGDDEMTEGSVFERERNGVNK